MEEKKLNGAFIKHFSRIRMMGKSNHRKGCVTWNFVTVEKDFRLQWDSNLDSTAKRLALISHCASPPVRRKIILEMAEFLPLKGYSFTLKMEMVREHGAPFSD